MSERASERVREQHARTQNPTPHSRTHASHAYPPRPTTPLPLQLRFPAGADQRPLRPPRGRLHKTQLHKDRIDGANSGCNATIITPTPTRATSTASTTGISDGGGGGGGGGGDGRVSRSKNGAAVNEKEAAAEGRTTKTTSEAKDSMEGREGRKEQKEEVSETNGGAKEEKEALTVAHVDGCECCCCLR